MYIWYTHTITYIYIYCTTNINRYVIWDIPCKPGYMMFVFHLLWCAFSFRRWLDKGPREGCASGARQEETDAGWEIVWVWWNPILKWWKTGIYLGKLHRPHCSPSLKSLFLQGNHHQMAWIQVPFRSILPVDLVTCTVGTRKGPWHSIRRLMIFLRSSEIC